MGEESWPLWMTLFIGIAIACGIALLTYVVITFAFGKKSTETATVETTKVEIAPVHEKNSKGELKQVGFDKDGDGKANIDAIDGLSIQKRPKDLPDTAGNMLEEMHMVCSKDDASWGEWAIRYFQNLLNGLSLGVIPAPEGMGDDRLQNNGFGINVLKCIIAAVCAWLVVFPTAWACFGKGQFGGFGGNNPCPGMEGGLFWKIVISILGMGYNMFGFLTPSTKEKSWIPQMTEEGVGLQWSTKNQATQGNLYYGTMLDMNDSTRNNYADHVGMDMGSGDWSTDVWEPVTQNIGRFGVALLILYL